MVPTSIQLLASIIVSGNQRTITENKIPLSTHQTGVKKKLSLKIANIKDVGKMCLLYNVGVAIQWNSPFREHGSNI